MIHPRQRLPLGLEAGDDAVGVEAAADQLQGDFAMDRRGLFGAIDDAHPAPPDFAVQLVVRAKRALD
jgi:hypothetical protein